MRQSERERESDRDRVTERKREREGGELLGKVPKWGVRLRLRELF